MHLVYTNGTVTEKGYFDWLKGQLGGCALQVKTVGRDPFSLVRGAIDDLGARGGGGGKLPDGIEGAWVVADTDNFRHLEQAAREAGKAGLRFILSNPCFEVWLIDHVRPCPGACCATAACEDEAVRLGVVRSPKHKGSSSKAKSIVFSEIEGRVGTAVANARVHNIDEKRTAREARPDNVAAYTVWTDVADMVAQLSGSRG